MGELKLPGLSTGIDTNALIQQLMEVNRRRLYLYQNDLETQQAKRDAVSELDNLLSKFSKKTSALSDSSQLKSFKSTSSDKDALSLEATSQATEGSHKVQIKQLATSSRFVHDGLEFKEDLVGEGYFIFSYNNKEMVIETTDETTLEGLVNSINEDPENPGVTASLLRYDGGSGEYHLVLAGQDNGSDYEISINDSTTQIITSDADSVFETGGLAADETAKIIDLDQFSFTDGGTSITGGSPYFTIGGTDADGNAIADVTLNVTSNTKVSHLISKINDAFDGVATATYVDGEIRLMNDTAGLNGTTLSITYNADGSNTSFNALNFSNEQDGGQHAGSMLAGFENATFTQTQEAKDSLIRVDGYPPDNGDANDASDWIARSSNTVDDVISGVTLKLHDVTGNETDGFDEIEVNLTRDTEKLLGNVQALVDSYNEIVDFFDANAGYDPETEEAGVLFGDYSITSLESSLRNPIGTTVTGFSSGVDSFVLASEIGIEFNREGKIDFSSDTFNEAINEDYMGVLRLIGAQKTGSAAGSAAIKFYDASETMTTAGIYEVKVTVSGGVITEAKMRTKGSSSWNDAEIDGNAITGKMDRDSNNDYIYDEAALQLTVDTSSDGTYESDVYVRQGFAGGLDDLLDDMLDSIDGRVQINKDALDRKIKYIKENIDAEEARLEDTEERLVAKYARLERNMSLLQQQFAGLSMV